MSKNDAKKWKQRYDAAQVRLVELRDADERLETLTAVNADLTAKNKRASAKLGAQTRKINKLDDKVTQGLDLSGTQADTLRATETENTTLREHLGAAIAEKNQWREDYERLKTDSEGDYAKATGEMAEILHDKAARIDELETERREAIAEIGDLRAKLHRATVNATEMSRFTQFKKSIRRDAFQSHQGKRPWGKTIQRMFVFFDMQQLAPHIDHTPDVENSEHHADVAAAEAEMFAEVDDTAAPADVPAEVG